MKSLLHKLTNSLNKPINIRGTLYGEGDSYTWQNNIYYIRNVNTVTFDIEDQFKYYIGRYPISKPTFSWDPSVMPHKIS